jgi:ABC-type branched-subunit amino acid transport system ATPase component
MIEARNLVKRYGSTMAVNGLSFSIRPGLVTGLPRPERRREARNGVVTLLPAVASPISSG